MFKRVVFSAALVAMGGLALAQEKAPEPKPEAQPATAPAAAPEVKPEAAPETKPEPVGPTLKVGDKAPALEVEKFLKGTPVTKFEQGKVYVVEFWATWCPPCIRSIPHITELQKKHADKGLTIIGVSVSEDSAGEYGDEMLAKVTKFVEERGDAMGYVVAYDGASKKMDKAYMEASQAQGIPTAFIVDKTGVVAYIGHPMDMDATLESVVAGTHDIKKLTEEHGKTLEAQGLMLKLETALQGGNEDEFYKLANEIVDSPGKADPQLLFSVAYLSSQDESPIKKKDLDLALKAAEKVNVATENKEPGVFALLAKIHLKKGDKAKATEIITRAMELAGKDEASAALVAHLKKIEDEIKAAK
jgi:thiol-disulfide isomerase/thioredoxin